MRLQAEITNEVIPKISHILKSYTKEDIVVYFSENAILFCIPCNNQIGVWIRCEISDCFSKYLVKSKQENTIVLKVEASQLAQAIAFDQTSIRVILSQLNEFVFLQLIHRSLDALKQLEHHVPVIILNQKSLEHYEEPDWEKETMMAKLPLLKNLAEWCNKVQSITKNLTISIIKNSSSGQLEVGLRAENEAKFVSVYTRFPDMEPSSNSHKENNTFSDIDKNSIIGELLESDADNEDSEVDNKDDPVECDVTVELKKFAKILKVQQLNPTVSLLYIHDKRLLRLYFETQSSKMTFVLNGISS